MGTGVSSPQDTYGPALLQPDEISKKTVPTMFKWPYDGNKVYICGTFNDWKEKIPMNKISDEKTFVTILNVPPGKHLFKFVVDDQWRVDPNQETAVDSNGSTVNVIYIKDDDREDKESQDSENSSSENEYPKKKEKSVQKTDVHDSSTMEDDEWGQEEKIFMETNKIPPQLPPHLKFTPLNSSSRTKGILHDPSIVPLPLMVTLNHVYFSQQGNVSVTGITQRYKDKFTTIVLYKPAPEKKNKDTGKEEDEETKL